jgi:uncharacterized protein (TIGR01319 family)
VRQPGRGYVRVAILADFGSTFTKVMAVDLAEAAVVGRAQEPTSLGGEILDGYENAVRSALRDIGRPADVRFEAAASSAGGGLRMVAVGLEHSLTTAAATTAALNAGARLAGVLTGRLAERDARRLAALAPEIVLFAGGTDGGQERLVIENATALADSVAGAHVVVACNKAIAKGVGAIFEGSARSVQAVPNVLPEIGVTSVDDARDAVSRLFIGEVIAGKKLSGSPRFARLVRMATPDAVLRAAVLAAGIHSGPAGDGILVTDVGGATTDVYSVLQRSPVSGFGTRRQGFARAPSIRTVEGDLGLRSNAPGVLQADGRWLERQVGAGPWLADACERRSARPAAVFPAGRERALDEHLAVSCMLRALERHCGTRGIQPGVAGRPALVEQGPNLTGCRVLVAGGGIVRQTPGDRLVRQALARLPASALAPRRCRVIVDRRYVLAAAGLLARAQPQIAKALLSRELREEIAHERW